MQHALPASGTFVWIRQRRWRVERSRREGGISRLDVQGPSGRATFLAPFDRPVATGSTRPVPCRYRHARAVVGQLAARAFTVRTPASAVGARIALLPHQLEPALAVERGARRLLIADAVGLGKTIEAGLVLAECLRRQPVTRALLIVPSGLRDEWADELTHRFGIQCTAADRPTLDRLSREAAHGDSPWLRAGVWIASLDFLKQPHVWNALPSVLWDLVVIDEAHTVAGHSDRHEAANALGRRARRLLLLSATPHSGDEDRFARLTRLGATGHDTDSLTVFRRTREMVGLARRRRVSWHRVGLAQEELDFLDALRVYERETLAASGRDGRDAALLLLSIFRKRALSTSAAAAATLKRRLAWLVGRGQPVSSDWIQPPFAFDEDDDLGGDERSGLCADTGLGSAFERTWLERLIATAEAAARAESKVRRLVSLVARAREPVVVFTEFRTSLETVAQRVPHAWRVAVLHGGLTDAERRDALGRFTRGDAVVLLATDVAGQGLNLQHAARWVVSLELPWNPTRLEQRLGRVDRLGQARATHLSLLVARHPAEDGLLLHLARRTLAARRALGADTLDAVDPGELQVGATLLADAPLAISVPARTPLAPCRTFERHARLHVRVLARQRRLSGRWPAHVALPACVCAESPRAGRLAGDLRTGGLLVFDAPILDETGIVLEIRPIGVVIPGLRERSQVSGGLLDAAERAVRERLSPRCCRLARIRRRLAAVESAHTAALHAAAVADLPATQAQAGLFDRRALAAREAAHDERERLGLQLRDRVTRLERSIVIARPVLRVVILPAR